MKKIKLILIGLGLIVLMGAQAQVTITDSKTMKLGSTDNVVSVSNVGKYDQAQGVIFGSTAAAGSLIESGQYESAGIYMDEDKIVMWSAGDDNTVSFCDEDLMVSGHFYDEAIIAFIDGDGYYYQVSDSVRKEQIATINSSLAKIMKLRGVEYYHKKNNENSAKTGNTTGKSLEVREKKSGFLAQEVETIVPEAVATNKAGIKYVNYQAIVPFLVEAMKEQQAQIAKQQQIIVQMQEQIERIELSLKTGKNK